ncbi:hypothetical protein [Amycolatopsis sp. NPDC059657]|uniref:hypothetical protein n=1 Tax=Amycolatopsis sp. NPDC059657 TaxID=3346899 RepID=UPI00366B88CD
MKRSSKLITLLAAFALLISGFFGVASATSADVAAQPDSSKVIGQRTEAAHLDQVRTAGTLGAISYRHLWCGVKGDFHLNLTGLGAYDGQAVAVTVVQAGTSGSEFFGAARMRVNNVSVWAGNVTAWVSVEWGEPLCVWTHYVAI